MHLKATFLVLSHLIILHEQLVYGLSVSGINNNNGTYHNSSGLDTSTSDRRSFQSSTASPSTSLNQTSSILASYGASPRNGSSLVPATTSGSQNATSQRVPMTTAKPLNGSQPISVLSNGSMTLTRPWSQNASNTTNSTCPQQYSFNFTRPPYLAPTGSGASYSSACQDAWGTYQKLSYEWEQDLFTQNVTSWVTMPPMYTTFTSWSTSTSTSISSATTEQNYTACDQFPRTNIATITSLSSTSTVVTSTIYQSPLAEGPSWRRPGCTLSDPPGGTPCFIQADPTPVNTSTSSATSEVVGIGIIPTMGLGGPRGQGCTLRASQVQLYYWPETTVGPPSCDGSGGVTWATRAPPPGTRKATMTLGPDMGGNTTNNTIVMTSPSVYLAVQGLSATEWIPGTGITVSEARWNPNMVVSMMPQDLSSIVRHVSGYRGSWQDELNMIVSSKPTSGSDWAMTESAEPYNLFNNQRPIPASAYFFAADPPDDEGLNGLPTDTIIRSDYHARISIPAQISSILEKFKTDDAACSMALGGLYDPPSAITTAQFTMMTPPHGQNSIPDASAALGSAGGINGGADSSASHWIRPGQPINTVDEGFTQVTPSAKPIGGPPSQAEPASAPPAAAPAPTAGPLPPVLGNTNPAGNIVHPQLAPPGPPQAPSLPAPAPLPGPANPSTPDQPVQGGPVPASGGNQPVGSDGVGSSGDLAGNPAPPQPQLNAQHANGPSGGGAPQPQPQPQPQPNTGNSNGGSVAGGIGAILGSGASNGQPGSAPGGIAGANPGPPSGGSGNAVAGVSGSTPNSPPSNGQSPPESGRLGVAVGQPGPASGDIGGVNQAPAAVILPLPAAQQPPPAQDQIIDLGAGQSIAAQMQNVGPASIPNPSSPEPAPLSGPNAPQPQAGQSGDQVQGPGQPGAVQAGAPMMALPGGVTVQPGGAAATISGHAISLAADASNLIVDGSVTQPVAVPSPMGSPAIVANTVQAVTMTGGDGVVTTGQVIAGQTLVPGESGAMVAGHSVSLATDGGFVVDGSSTARAVVQTAPANPNMLVTLPPKPGATADQIIPARQTSFTGADGKPTSAQAIGGQTLVPGGPGVTTLGHVLSAASNGAIVVDGASTVTPTAAAGAATGLITLHNGNGAPQVLTGVPRTTVGSDGKTTLQEVLGGQTISAGASAITVSGHLMSLASNGDVIVDGTSTVTPSPLSSPKPTAFSFTVNGVSKPLSVSMTSTVLANGQTIPLDVVAGTTISPGAFASTVAGHLMSLEPNGALVVDGTRTVGPVSPMTFSVSGASQPLTASVTSIVGQDGQTTSEDVVDGTTITAGSAAVTIDGHQLSVATNGALIVDGTSTVGKTSSSSGWLDGWLSSTPTKTAAGGNDRAKQTSASAPATSTTATKNKNGAESRRRYVGWTRAVPVCMVWSWLWL